MQINNYLIKSPNEKAVKTYSSIAQEWVREPLGARRLLLDPVIKTINWVKWSAGELGETLTETKKSFTNANHFLVLLALPETIGKLGAAILSVGQGLINISPIAVLGSAIEAFVQGAFALGSVTKTVKIAHLSSTIQLSSYQLDWIKTVRFTVSLALFWKGISGAAKQLKILARNNWDTKEAKLAWIKLANRVSLIAIGTFEIISYTMQVKIIAEWAFLSISTTFLLTALGGHYYNKLYVKESS